MMSAIEIINIQTGKIVRTADKSEMLVLTKGQAMLDPATQEYDARRKIVRPISAKRPPTDMEKRVIELESLTKSQGERIAQLEEALNRRR